MLYSASAGTATAPQGTVERSQPVNPRRVELFLPCFCSLFWACPPGTLGRTLALCAQHGMMWPLLSCLFLHVIACRPVIHLRNPTAGPAGSPWMLPHPPAASTILFLKSVDFCSLSLREVVSAVFIFTLQPCPVSTWTTWPFLFLLFL